MALRKLAVVLGNENRDEESQEYSRRAVENSDRLPAKEKYLVQAYHYSDYPETWGKGVEAYQKLIEIEPDNFTALHNLALQLAQLERWDEAVSLYERAAATGDEFQFLYHEHGRFLWTSGTHERSPSFLRTSPADRAGERRCALRRGLLRARVGRS